MDRFSSSRVASNHHSSRNPGGSAVLFLIVVLLLLGVVRGLGSEQVPWISKEPDLWTLQDAERILWESPWVQEQRFRFYNSRRRVRQITYFVRLQSARPVRLALAKAFLSQPEDYVVSVNRTDPQKMHELSESFKLEDELVLSLIMSPRFVHTRLNNHSLESWNISYFARGECS